MRDNSAETFKPSSLKLTLSLNQRKEAKKAFKNILLSPCVILLYANHRLENIRNGPNLAETKRRSSLQIQDLTNAIPP